MARKSRISKIFCKGLITVCIVAILYSLAISFLFPREGLDKPPPPPSSKFKFEGCYSNNPRIFSNWNPNNLKDNPDRNSICEKRALSTNNKYYGLENNNGCLVFNNNFPSNNKLNIPQSDCTNSLQVAVFEKYDQPTTFHPPAPPPHAPWNISSHISHIQNPIMGHSVFNDPLPSVNATFIKRENPNIPLNPAPAPSQ